MRRPLTAFALILVLVSLLGARPAGAFVLLRYAFGPGGLDPELSLQRAPVWNANPAAFDTLADGVQVSVQPGFAEAFAAGNDVPAAAYEQGIFDAFAAWETPDLRFDVSLDAAPGGEINLFFTEGATNPDFIDRVTVSGLAFVDTAVRNDRMLTSGVLAPGRVITNADIYIAWDRLAAFFEFFKFIDLLEEEDRLNRYVNLLIHEIGHGLGLGHPNEIPDLNYDDDGDPFTVYTPANPFAPWEGLALSSNIDVDTIMRGGLPIGDPSTALVATELYADDRSGLNFLYPTVPEPGIVWLMAAAAWSLRRLRR